MTIVGGAVAATACWMFVGMDGDDGVDVRFLDKANQTRHTRLIQTYSEYRLNSLTYVDLRSCVGRHHAHHETTTRATRASWLCTVLSRPTVGFLSFAHHVQSIISLYRWVHDAIVAAKAHYS
jgi:hypothetical protein